MARKERERERERERGRERERNNFSKFHLLTESLLTERAHLYEIWS